ncbi:MAG TPA: proton-conducting transporter membrane subunit [Candidatus Wallbacteria bacterium]|nr:proton-conducting transporter membrane subunit [Candidatus Wallbacteria bacterium]
MDKLWALKMFPAVLIAVPFFLSLLFKFIKNVKIIEWLAILSSFFNLLTSALLLSIVTVEKPFMIDIPKFSVSFFWIDSLSAFMAFVISLISFATILYSRDYMRHEAEKGLVEEAKLPDYYFKIELFMASMLLVVFLNNLGLVWVAVEATTLASAFLVAFYRNRESMEAAWKYLVICTVAIALSLFGIVLLNHSITNLALIPGGSLDYSILIYYAKFMDSSMIKLAFIFVLIGYGTKAGLAPMHTWLPDAHSQTPTPVSALLSGVLLSCATYALIRFQHIVNLAIGPEFTSNLMIIFGLISLLVAFPFIILQNDIKRLLAYSSIEHTGIIFLGLGFGGELGIIGALYHMFNHAILKSMMFLTAGSIVQVYETREISKIKGIFERNKFLGSVIFLGGIGICGMPPFGVFFSEFMILLAGVHSKSYVASTLYLLFMTLIFIGFLNHILKMAFGHFHHEDDQHDKNAKTEIINLHLPEMSAVIVISSLFLISVVSGFYYWKPIKDAIFMSVFSLIVKG